MDKCEVPDLRVWREIADWHVWSVDPNGKPGKLLMAGLPNLSGYTGKLCFYCQNCNGQWPRYEAAVRHVEQPVSAHRRPTPRR